MIRTFFALAAVAVMTMPATAQPRQPLPLSPGVVPAAPFGPGFPVVPSGPIPQRAQSNTVLFPVALPWGWGVGWSYRTLQPVDRLRLFLRRPAPDCPGLPRGTARSGRTHDAGQRRTTPPATPAGIVLAREFPATLTLQLPAAADVWLDGKKQDGESDAVRELKSPVLKPGATHTFNVKARWTKGGKTYEAKRAVTLGPGDHSRLYIVSGDEVNE